MGDPGDFYRYANNGHGPDQGKQAPAPYSSQVDQRKRCIGAGNQKIDRGVIKLLQPGFGAWQGNTVVEGRCCVQQDQRCLASKEP